MPNEFKAKNGVITPVLQTSTAGTAGAPVITKSDDLNTGLFFPSADAVAVSTGGTERFRIDSSGNLGIGTSSPTDKLTVLTTQGINTFANPLITYGANTNWPAGFANIYDSDNVDQFVLLNARMTGGTRAAPTYTSFTGGVALKVDGASGGLAVHTITNGAGVSSVERFRIASNGAWGLSGTNYGTSGQVLTSNGSGSAPTWQAPSGGSPAMTVVTATTQTAVANAHYVLTNAAASTATLPASPAAGDIVWVTVGNGRTDNVVARNGQNIMGLAEDMTLNNQYATAQLRFANSTLGWRLL